jgi:acetyl-CoA carboxylase carboxyl transferase subunit beta
MSLFDWFANRQKTEPKVQQQQEREIADGLWTKCPIAAFWPIRRIY